MKIALIDNYDSFTYNLAHLLKELGTEVDVFRNDRFAMEALEAYDKIVLSPGPGIPSEAGQLCDVIRTYMGRKPILGVCLGEQAIGEVFGGTLVNLDEVYHGVQTGIRITGKGSCRIFDGIGEETPVGRYHSWVVSREGFPECLEVTAESREGLIMALRHKEFDIDGLQFHPESVLTPEGPRMIANWLRDK